MRVDSQSNIPAAIRTNVADLLGRLDTGDVIKAKVLEITSSEIALRLFDGSVLKAAALEGLEAKVGQTLTLAVTSKNEGTLFLETVKDTSQLSSTNTDTLKKMLESFKIKPDVKNMELAAEFMKAGNTATASQIYKAAGLMERFKGLNAEKAAFISSKGLQTDQVKLELLIKLLNGDIKLGEQLKELQVTLNNTSRTFGKSLTNDAITKSIFEDQASILFNRTVSNQSETDTLGTGKALNVNVTSVKTTSAGQQAAVGTSTANNGQQATAGTSVAAGQQETMGTLAVTASQQGNEGATAAAVGLENPASSTSSESIASASTAPATAPNISSVSDPGSIDDMMDNVNHTSNMKGALMDKGTGNTLGAERNALTEAVNQPGGQSSLLATALQKNDSINTFDKADSSTSDPFAKLKDAVNELFININSDELASDMDANKLHNDLNNKLDILKATIQTSGLAGLAGGKSISAATALLDDSVKLLNQLSSNGMLYYQLPINLSGCQTTAELYVMKREPNKRRIDPHNTVMFVSLDTNNLGRIETLLDVKGNNVSINLRTELPQINNLLKENIKYLYSGLSDCGYKLVDIKYALIDSASPPMKQEQLLSKMMDTNHIKVDMRI